LCVPESLFPVVDTESHLEHSPKRRSFVGTHEYVAPEIIAEGGYGGSVDWWAFGILLYEMIYGKTPFKGNSQMQTLENILDTTEEVEFPTNETDPAVSDECKDLINQLLAKDVTQRLQNALYIKAHPFFRSVAWPRTLVIHFVMR
jgi:protein-serine/threonine kinase